MIDKPNACIFWLRMISYQKNIKLFEIKSIAISKKEFDNGQWPASNDGFLKLKIKSHGDEVTGFYNKKIPKLDSNHTCVSAIGLAYSLKKDDDYYPQVFLKECKCIEKNVGRHIHDNLSDFSYSCGEFDEEKMLF